MSEIKALVLRRTVGNVADLLSGALALNNFQWGLAKNDDLLVAKDDAGVYHYFYGSSAIDQKIADQLYAREPVSNIGALPSTDPDGTLRLVENIETVYVKSNGSWISINASNEYLKLSTASKLKLFTGFVDSNRGITYDQSTRKWTLTGTGTTEISWNGVVSAITLPWLSPAHPATTNVFHYLYSHDGVNYITSTTPWLFSDLQIAGAYYDSNILYRFGLKETHGATQDPDSHRQNHQYRGTYRVSGGTLTTGSYLIEPSTPTNAGNRPLFDSTTISDEDLQTANLASSSEVYTRYWASADGSRNWSVGGSDIVGVGGTYPLYDNAGTPTELSTGKFMWIYRIEIPVTDDAQSQQFRTVMISGSEFFGSKAEALLGSIKYRIGNLESISPEFTCVRRILIQTNASYGTVGKFRIVTDQEVQGSRTSSLQASSSLVTSVNGLTGAVTLTQDEVPAGATYGRFTNTQVTDLTDGGDSALHYHATDRNRENHTGTQTASTISDFASTVRGVVLTGLSTAINAVITATDTVLGALGKLQAQITDLTTTVSRKADNKTFSFTRGEVTGNGWANLISVTLPNSASTTTAWFFNIIQSGAGTNTDQRVGILKVIWRNGSIAGSEFVSFSGSSTIEFGYTGTLALNSALNVYCYNSSYPYLKFEIIANYGGTVEGGAFSATNPSMTLFPVADLRGEIYNDARYLQLVAALTQTVSVGGVDKFAIGALACVVYNNLNVQGAFHGLGDADIDGDLIVGGETTVDSLTLAHSTFGGTTYTYRADTYPLSPVAGASTAHYFTMSGATPQTTSVIVGPMTAGQSCFASYQTRGTGTGTLTITYVGIDGGARACTITGNSKTLDLQFVRKGSGYICIGAYYIQ